MQQLHRALSIHSSQYLYLLSLSPQLLVSFLPADQTLLLLQDIHAARASHVGSIPQRSQHGRPGDDNPVVHFFKNIVSSTSSHYGRGLSLTRFSWVGDKCAFRNSVSTLKKPPNACLHPGLLLKRSFYCNSSKILYLSAMTTKDYHGGEGHKPGYGSGKFYEHKSAHKGHKGSYHEGQGTLSKIFKLEIPSLQLGSPLLEKL
uniref:Myelin basic protein n=1 Tax=Meleagris gallopavo TaxID=9103 RepID=A0A803YDB1_MELGA